MKRAADDVDGGDDVATAAGPTGGEAPQEKKGKIEIDEEQQSSLEKATKIECAICLSEASEDVEMRDHECSTCKKGAWMICESCHNHILSRACPVCKSHYAPLFLYAIPGIILPLLAVQGATKEETFENYENLAVLDMKRRMFTASVRCQNVCVWRALFDEEKTGAEGGDETGKMFFCLMGAAAWDEEDSPDSGDQHLIFEMRMSRARVASGRFTFDNAVWDELMEAIQKEEEDEEDEEDEDEVEDEVEGEGEGKVEGNEAEASAGVNADADTGGGGAEATEPVPAPAAAAAPAADDDVPVVQALDSMLEDFIALQQGGLADIKQYVVPTETALAMMRGQWMSALLKGLEVHAMTMCTPAQWVDIEADFEKEMSHAKMVALGQSGEKGGGGAPSEEEE